MLSNRNKLSIKKISDSDNAHFYNSIQAILQNYQHIYSGVIDSIKHSDTIDYIKNFSEEIAAINKDMRLISSRKYLLLIGALNSFIKKITRDNEIYLYEDLYELLADKLKNLKQVNWKKTTDITNINEIIRELSRIHKKETDNSLTQIWKKLKTNLIPNLESNSVESLIIKIRIEMRLPGHVKNVKDLEREKNINVFKSQSQGFEDILNQTKKLIEESDFENKAKENLENLLINIKHSPCSNYAVRNLLKEISKSNSPYPLSLQVKVLNLQSELSDWNLENLEKLCIQAMQHYAYFREDSDSTINDIYKRMEDFIYAVVEKIIIPLDEIFSTSLYSKKRFQILLKNLNSEYRKTLEENWKETFTPNPKWIKEKCFSSHQSTSNDEIESDNENDKRSESNESDERNNNESNENSDEKNSESNESSNENSNEKNNNEIINKVDEVVLKHIRHLFQFIEKPEYAQSKIEDEIIKNPAVLKAFASSYFYLKHLNAKYFQFMTANAKESTKLFIQQVIELRNCPAETIRIEALKYVEGEGIYGGWIGRQSSLEKGSRYEYLVNSGLITEKTRLLSPLLHSKLCLFKPAQVSQDAKCNSDLVKTETSQRLLFSS